MEVKKNRSEEVVKSVEVHFPQFLLFHALTQHFLHCLLLFSILCTIVITTNTPKAATCLACLLTLAILLFAFPRESPLCKIISDTN